MAVRTLLVPGTVLLAGIAAGVACYLWGAGVGVRCGNSIMTVGGAEVVDIASGEKRRVRQ